MAGPQFPYLDELKNTLTRLDQLDRSIDRSEKAHDHAGMTDLNRQQVSDMLAASEAKVDARLANFDTSIKTGFADLRVEFAEMRAEMAKMRGDTEKQSHDSTKWIIGSVFGMLSLSVAILAAIINFNKGDKPALAAQASPQQSPLVLAVPAGTTVLSAPQAPATAQPPAK